MNATSRYRDKLLGLWQARWFQRWGLPILFFLVAFLPRAIYPVSRPYLWAERSYRFSNAILNWDLAVTYQSSHPGVSLMWLSGLGIEIFERLQGEIPADQFLAISPAPPGLLVEATQAGILPLAGAISLGIALTYPLLGQLAGRTIAVAAVLFMALDPFHITYSKSIHVDALLATLMILSALFLLAYLKVGRWHNLIISGIFAGLSFLTKSPSFFLVPYVALMVTVNSVHSARLGLKAYGIRGWSKLIWQVMRTLLVWLGLAVLVFVLLYPAMWVIPRIVLERMLSEIVLHTREMHEHPVYFLGRVWKEDPGLPFYLAVIGWKTTIITLPLMAAAAVFAVYHRSSPQSRVFWATVTYAIFFTLQMAIGNWKQLAYVAPLFPALSIIAAFGLVWTVEWIGQRRSWEPGQWGPLALITLVILTQALLVLGHHPYYGTHNNLILGGSKIARQVLPLQDQGEGMDLAARYLNDLPYGQTQMAAVFWRNARPFEREFVGRRTRDQKSGARYRIYDLNSVLREFHEDDSWYESWLDDRQQEPLFSVTFDGIPYVWIYGELPTDPVADGPTFDVDNRIGDHIQLRQVRLNKDVLVPGEPLVIAPVWEVGGKVIGNYTVFNHLIGADGQLMDQQDNIPMMGTRPTETWQEGEILEDFYYLLLDESLPPGEYELSLGLYDSETIVRIPAYDASGVRLPEDRIVVGKVTLQEN